METLHLVFIISIYLVLSANARYLLGIVITRWTGPQFPWATFTINVTGSFAIGLFSISLACWLPNPHARLLVVVGFLGGYTTFSSYSIRIEDALGAGSAPALFDLHDGERGSWLCGGGPGHVLGAGTYGMRP